MHDELRFPAGLGTSFSACCCIIPTKASAFVCCWPWVRWPCGLPHYGAVLLEVLVQEGFQASRVSIPMHSDHPRAFMGTAGSGLNETSLHSSCQEISYIVPPNAVPVRVTFCSPCLLCLWHPWRCSAGFTQLGEVELTLQEALNPAVLAWGIKFNKKNSCFDQGDIFIKHTYISIYLFIYLRERKEKEKKKSN